MIRLTEIEGRDIGQHRVISKKITGNVLGLWGPSGSGKSTVLQLVEWLLTGSIEHPDAIGEFVRNSAHDNVKKMTGSAKFLVDGAPAEIDRSHSVAGTSTRELRWEYDPDGGSYKVTKKTAAEVNDLMASLIGANQKAISSLVFIRQGAFSKLFSGLDSERHELFVRLLMLGHMEKISRVVDTFRKQVAGSVQDLSAVRDQAASLYDEARQQFEEVEAELGRTRSYEKELETGASICRAWDLLNSRERDAVEAANALRAEALARCVEVKDVGTWLSGKLDKVNSLVATMDAGRQLLQTANSLDAQISQTENLVRRISAWLEKYDKLQSLNEKLSQMEAVSSKPDPRVRIQLCERLVADHKLLETMRLQLATMPVVDTQCADLRHSSEEASRICDEAALKVRSAESDLKRLEELKALSVCGDGTVCHLCGSDNPDREYITMSIERVATLVDVLRKVADETRAAKASALRKLEAAQMAASAHLERVAILTKDIAAVEMRLAGQPGVDQLRADMDALVADLPAYDMAVSLRRHLDAERTTLKESLGTETYTREQLEAAQEKIKSLVARRQSMPSPECISEELESRKAELETETKELTAVSRVHDVHIAAEAAVEKQESELKSIIDAALSTCPYLISEARALSPVLTMDTLKTTLDSLRERQSEFDRKTGIYAAARNALHDADSRLQEVELRIAEQAARLKVVKELESVRSVFTPSGVTADYLDYQFRRIATVAQDHLADMSADFMVTASDKRSLSFDFLRLNSPDGVWLSQNRMSGGQQVKLAIAVLLAIHELIIPDVGLLVLDEPSTHLCTESRIALAEVLRTVGDRGNFQLIVCDHAYELRDAYTDVIELGNAEQ